MASIYDKSSLVLIPSGTKTGKVFSQKPVSGDGDFTFTRASAATRVNADGNIEKETQNLLLQSNSFNTTWSTSNASVTGGQGGYDGSSDAWILSKSSANGRIYQSVSFSGVHTFSVYAKAGTNNWIRLRDEDNVGAYFDLSGSGAVGSINLVIDAKIESVGSGWFHCSITGNFNATDILIYVADANGDTSGTSGSIYIQDAQLEQGLVARDYIETTTAAVYGGITDNTPRLDYTDSSCPALLLEPLRTNILPQSEYLVGISAVNATTSANETISPDGGNNATKLSALIAAPSSQWARYYNIVQPNQKQALSIYAKAGNIDDFTITYYDQSTGDLFFNYDLGAGLVSAPTGNANYVDADIQDMGNGWYRCIAVVNAQASGANAQFQVSAGVQRVVPNIGDYVYIYGYQWEQDATYATSYIPTYGSSVSRVKDDVYNDSGSNVIGQTEGTIFIEINRFGENSTSSYENLIFLGDGSISNFINIVYYVSNNRYQAQMRSSGITSASIVSDSEYTGTIKLAMTYSSSKVSFFINGAKMGDDTSVTLPAATLNKIGLMSYRTSISADNFIGENKQTLLFKTALTDQEAIDLTTI
jgi:hypothetical protein